MRTSLFCFFVTASLAMGQDNPFSAFNQRGFNQLKTWLLASAEKMPEAEYAFRPAETVRTFGQVLGHVADEQYRFCSAVLEETNPAPKIQQTKTTKADLIPALRDALAYCGKAYTAINDAAASQTVKMFGGMPKPVVLTANNMHLAEHYGNLVVYLRMKNLVPPSSEPRPQPQPKKQ